MKVKASRKVVVGISVLVAVGLLFAAWQFDRDLPASRRDRSAPIEDLVAPKPLTDAEREAAQQHRGGATSVQLDQGAWVQVAGKDGRVAQQYTAQKIDPQPGAFMSMTEPRTVFYMEDGRVATLRANSGRVHVPNRALESGTFNGDVVIRFYRPSPGAVVNLAKDSPSMILESEQLEFDQVLNQIGCQSAFRLTTDILTFDGEGLDLLLGSDGKSIERLTVDHPLGPIVIDRARQSRTRASAMPQQLAPNTVLMTPVSMPAEGRENAQAAAAPAPAERFYRLELHDDVEILRYSTVDRAWSKGDELVAIFTLKSDLVSKEIVMNAAPVGSPDPLAFRGRTIPLGLHLGIASHIAGAVIAAAPEPQGDLLVVRFTGKLKMVPVAAGEKVPDSAQGMNVRIDGQEVELANQAGLALRAKDVDMDLVKDALGRTTPKLLVATGAVEATNVAQTLWCDALRAQFESTQADAAPRSANASDPALGPSEVTRVDADHGVQIQLKDGARVFADGMIAFPPKGLADLRGPGLSIVRGGVMIDAIPSLSVNDRNRTAESPGGGRARSWQGPIVPAELQGKIELPAALAAKPEMDAQWKGQMTFTDRAQNGAVLDLAKDVRIRAEPRPEEFDALDAQTVHLELDRRPSAGGALATAVQANAHTPAGGDIRPRRLIATGDARMENQVWLNADRAGEPRLFQVRGQTIDYDAVTGEASVPSAGSVLVNVPAGGSLDPKAQQNRTRDQSVAGGGLEGVSRFRWGSAMNLKRLVDEKFLMSMDQSVELVRAGPKKSDTLTLTCDRLEATLERRIENDSNPKAGTQPAFNLGGSSEVQRVRGIGRCFIRTPDYDVECEEFDYNVVTQIAEMRARPGRLVNVLPKGQGTPLRAAAMTWDLQSGRIQIRSGSGTIGQ
ncbi:MAG: hypothetical protein WCL33_03270 [Planctomycetota bacterium]